MAVDWPPLDITDSSFQKPRVEATADAECLYWDIRVANEFLNHQDALTTYTHMVTVKIFTDAGVKKFGTVDLPYENKEHIGEVAGRTIEPDGSIVELSKDAVFDHVLEKVGRKRTKAVSFAMPGLKPGAIIEYRYKVFEDTVWLYLPIQASMEMPVRHLVFHVKPLDGYETTDRMNVLPFQVSAAPFKEDANGFYTTSVDNIPAFHPEPDAPPDGSIKPWLLVYYSENSKEDWQHFWKKYGKKLYAEYNKELKVNGDVQQIAQQVTSGAKSDDEKVDKLYYYCQKHIKNIFGRDVSDAERQDFKPNRSTIDTLKRGQGTSHDITLAFLALVQAAGFDANLAYLLDRDAMIFRKEIMLPYFNSKDVAVNVGGKWKFYDPATKWLAPGQVRWQEEAIEALLTDPKDPEFVIVPVQSAAESVRKQTGRFKLEEDGTVEGDLTETFTGQIAAGWRFENIDHSAAERQKEFEDTIKFHLPGAEVTEAKISDPTDVSIPVTLSCHIKMEGFATRTGKRLFFTPAVFQLNQPVRYSEASRKYDVFFHYPWSEIEDVSIAYPDSFQLDHADVAAPIKFDPVGGYYTHALSLKGRLLYHRDFVFGRNGSFVFPLDAYPTLKKIFDGVHDNDAHMLTLKQEPTVAEAK